MRLGLSVFFLLMMTFSTAVPARAQQDVATIVGEVTDASRGVIPKAAVSVTNIATGITTTTETNERGLYNVAGLRPGEYVLIVESPVQPIRSIGPHPPEDEQIRATWSEPFTRLGNRSRSSNTTRGRGRS
jgi:hypothetical protein